MARAPSRAARAAPSMAPSAGRFCSSRPATTPSCRSPATTTGAADVNPRGCTSRRSPDTSWSQPLPAVRRSARPPGLAPPAPLSRRKGAAAEPRSPDPRDSSIRFPRRKGWLPVLGCWLRSRLPAVRTTKLPPALRAGASAEAVGRRAAVFAPKANVSRLRSVPALARSCK